MDTSSSVSIWVSIGVTGKQLKGKSEDCLKIAGRLLKIGSGLKQKILKSAVGTQFISLDTGL